MVPVHYRKTPRPGVDSQHPDRTSAQSTSALLREYYPAQRVLLLGNRRTVVDANAYRSTIMGSGSGAFHSLVDMRRGGAGEMEQV